MTSDTGGAVELRQLDQRSPGGRRPDVHRARLALSETADAAHGHAGAARVERRLGTAEQPRTTGRVPRRYARQVSETGSARRCAARRLPAARRAALACASRSAAAVSSASRCRRDEQLDIAVGNCLSRLCELVVGVLQRPADGHRLIVDGPLAISRCGNRLPGVLGGRAFGGSHEADIPIGEGRLAATAGSAALLASATRYSGESPPESAHSSPSRLDEVGAGGGARRRRARSWADSAEPLIVRWPHVATWAKRLPRSSANCSRSSSRRWNGFAAASLVRYARRSGRRDDQQTVVRRAPGRSRREPHPDPRRARSSRMRPPPRTRRPRRPTGPGRLRGGSSTVSDP